MQIEQIPDTWKIEKHDSSYAVWDDTGQARCGAKCRDGSACLTPPVKGKLRCRMHPGYPVKGKLHPKYKHGRYTSEGQTPIRERYGVYSTEELLDLTENLLMSDLRIKELFETVDDEGDFSASAKELRLLLKTAKRHYLAGKMKEFDESFSKLEVMIETAATRYDTWEEILKWNTARQTMTQGFHKMEMDKKGLVSTLVVKDIVLGMAELFFRINRLQDAQERENAFRLQAYELISLTPTED